MRTWEGRPRTAKVIAGLAWLGAGLAGCNRGEEAGGGMPGGGMPPMPVDVSPALRDTVIDEIVATGEVEAVQAIQLRPDIDGRIVEILVREGSGVSRGTGLFKIDDEELRAQVARLEAQRDLANQALARTRRLVEQDAASTAELEQAEATARSNQAELDLQQVRLERTLVRAPFTGVVGERLVSLGDYVTTSTPLITLQTVNPQRASFEVPERYAAALAVGQQVAFDVAAVPGRRFAGVVDFVDPRVQLPARTIQVKAQVPNPDRVLQAGMFIEARLATEVRPNAVLVREEAVVQLEIGTFVWVIGSGGQALRRSVVLGVRRPGWVEIVEGVEAGEQVITAGMERLFEGATVMPRQAIEQGGDPAAEVPDDPADAADGETPVGDAPRANGEPDARESNDFLDGTAVRL